MGNTHSAVSCRRPDAIKELLRSAEAGDVQSLSTSIKADTRLLFVYSVFGGNSAWHKAAKGGHAAVLEALDAEIHRQYAQDNKDLTEVLKPGVLRLGTSAADVVTRLINKSNVKGFTPLMLACSGGHTDVVAWLIKHGADVWKHERVRRHTALHCAAEVGATDAIRLLLARSGSEQHPGNNRTLLEQGNQAGLTALHYAVYCEQNEVVAQLAAQDADITAQAEFPDLDWGCINAGDTPMHVAAHRGNIDAIQIMLKAYNEKSGAFLPSQDGARRLRDPRAMRNDYGRLPYHLAMRKGLTWLGEMLDPSVPVRFLLTDEQLDANTSWGPQRLATIAAAVLHRSLIADLKAIQAEQAAAAGNTAAPGPPAAPQQQQRHQPAALRCRSPSASPVEEVSSSTSAGSAPASRRRWGQHRRANSDTAGWANRLAEISPLPSLGSRRLSTGGLGRSSRRGRTATPSSTAAAVAAAAAAGPSVALPGGSERMNLQEALGQLSPRAVVAALVGSSSGVLDDALPSSSSSAAAAVPAGAFTSAAADAGSAWRRLVSRPARPGSKLQQQPACASPECEQQAGGEASGLQKSPEPCTLQRSASDSICTVLLDVVQQDWQKLVEAGAMGGGSQADKQQEGKQDDAIPAVHDSGKVSPFPELKPDMPDGVLEGLLELYMAESRCSTVVSPCSQTQQQQCCGSECSDEGQTCGVCLDAAPSAVVNPCKHTMCAECALDMVERCPLGTAVCPFCRCIIKSFGPVSSSKPSSCTKVAPVTGSSVLGAAGRALPVC